MWEYGWLLLFGNQKENPFMDFTAKHRTAISNQKGPNWEGKSGLEDGWQ